MTRLNQLDIRQRYNRVVLATLAIAGCLLLLSLYWVIRNYANAYTSHYWQDYTGKFSESAQYGITLGAKAQSEAVVNTFANDKNVLNAAIYNAQNQLLAFRGNTILCNANLHNVDKAFYMEAENHWCFYVPVFQDLPAGAFEKQLITNQKPVLLGHVALVVSKAEMNALLQQILLVTGLIVIAFLAIVFIVLRRFSGTFTGPMLEMIRVLKKVAGGDSGVKVAFSGADDIVAMGDAFNAVLMRIETHERILEQKIADRTNELKIALANSEAANHYKTQIVATVSHEMKSPLHVIQNCLAKSYASLTDNSDNELMREYHHRALMRTADLNDLINHILLHGKLEAKGIEAQWLPVDVLPLMQSCSDKLSPYLERKRNSLKLEGKACSIVSDAELLSHIVNNLLNNACKFTDEGQITLNWWHDDSHFVIQVTDTGCGIPEIVQHKIFDSFWQVDMGLSRKYGGTGLGLTVTKQFVDLLGGEILVESAEGRGSIFTVHIPNQVH